MYSKGLAFFALLVAVNAATITNIPLTKTTIAGPSGTITKEEHLPLVETKVLREIPVVHDTSIVQESPVVVEAKSLVHETPLVVGTTKYIHENPTVLTQETPLVVEAKSLIHEVPTVAVKSIISQETPLVYETPLVRNVPLVKTTPLIQEVSSLGRTVYTNDPWGNTLLKTRGIYDTSLTPRFYTYQPTHQRYFEKVLNYY